MKSNRVIVGAGGTFIPGWLSLKEAHLDITQERQWARWFVPESLDEILAEHVWEHLTLEEGYAAAVNCYRYLKPGGHLRIAVPDGFHVEWNYIKWVAPVIGFTPDHKVLFNYRSLSELLERAGFTVFLREWFDERGFLHTSKWPAWDDNVRRRAMTIYSMFLSMVVGADYTSLIVDSFKQ